MSDLIDDKQRPPRQYVGAADTEDHDRDGTATVQDTDSAPEESVAARPWPLGTTSGLYVSVGTPHGGRPDTEEGQVFPILPTFGREELRLDVDNNDPTMTASGTSYAGPTQRFHWIAGLTATGAHHWTGSIWHHDGTVPFPYSHVSIRVSPLLRSAQVTFSGGTGPRFTRRYLWRSPAFHPVEFEYDCTTDANPVFAIGTHDHPNRPPNVPSESLSLETAYRRTGFAVTKSGGDGNVPLSGAGANGTWSDAEMHDAMQVYWSRFSNAPRWSLWVLWAALHDRGSSLGGIMFDDIGPNHRQGTAIFTEAFIANPPAGDPAPDAWVRRMRFWTAAHEMGHAFNLAHSWQKSLGPPHGIPWLPALADEPEARSFMNYPFNVAGGESAFFSDFEFKFSPAELLFMRHAPSRFVQMGNANWFDQHGFEQPEDSLQRSGYRLELRANRDLAVYEFLEPVILELKLTNTTAEPRLVRGHALGAQSLLVIISPTGKPARQWLPYARYCTQPGVQVLRANESIYESLPIYAGLNGWDIADPGRYTVQVAIEMDGEFIVSNPLILRVAAPQSWEAEAVAGDFLAEDVGRTLAFGGTAVLDKANDTLREVIDRLPDSGAAVHAAAALARPLVKDYRILRIPQGSAAMTSAHEADASVQVREAEVEHALAIVEGKLASSEAAQTLGHITLRRTTEVVAEQCAAAGAVDEAASLQSSMCHVLSERGVKESVLKEVESKKREFEAAASNRNRKRAPHTKTSS